MQIRDINKPINSKTLNETLARKFGTRLDVDSFTLEQLQDARNKIRTKLSQIETNESFGGLPKNETYSKNKLFLDILNAAISERADVDEAAKPDYIDLDGDGDKKEPMKKAAKDKKKKKTDESSSKVGQEPQPYKLGDDKGCKPGFVLDRKTGMCMPKQNNRGLPTKESIVREGAVKAVCKDCGDTFGKPTTDCKNDCNDPTQDCWVKESEYMKESKHIDEGKDIINNYFTKLIEGAEDKAELVMASKDMVDRLTGWMEDTAEMQSESMLELADAIRDELGQQQSDTFVNTVKPALEQLYAAMETTRVSLTQGVAQLTGEGGEPAVDMGEPTGDIPPEVEPEEPAMEPTVDDEFGAAAPATGGTEEAGRARRESIYYKKKAMLEASRRLGTILSKKN